MKKVLNLKLILYFPSLFSIIILAIFLFTLPTQTFALTPGLVKSTSSPTIYYLASDGYKYTFPSQTVFLSWYKDFSTVKNIASDLLTSYPLGGSINLKPNTTATDPSLSATKTARPKVVTPKPVTTPAKVIPKQTVTPQVITTPTSSIITSVNDINLTTKQGRINIQMILNQTLNPTPNLKLDGNLGSKSIEAVKRFQLIKRLVSDGKIGLITRTALFNAKLNSSSGGSTCSDGAIFNPLTGQPCTTINSSYPLGCTSNIGFSSINGLSCSSTSNPATSGGGGGGGGGGGSSDKVRPTISSFTIPLTSTSLSINITTFTATDNKGVTGYLITESSSTPSLNNPNWSTLSPTTYTVSSEGYYTLYGWTRDSAGNVSNSLSGNISVLTAEANTYYIASGGNDTTGDGSVLNPWASLYKACNSVTVSGQTIHVLTGTYIENQACNLAIGVSLVGASVNTTTIQCTYSFDTTSEQDKGCLRLSSASPNTNGNQTISDITFDGVNLTASRAIAVYNRSNVKILNTVVKDFFAGGIIFGSSNIYSTAVPLTYNENNEIGFTTIDNCGDTDGTYDGWGLISMVSQKDMLIHDNLLYSNKRVGSHNGNIINGGGTRFSGVKYYNNHSWKPDAGYSGWNFHLEFWGNDGGFEIYNNTFTGGTYAIAPGGYGLTAMTSGHDFDWSIHDNIFEQNDGIFNTDSASAIHLESRILGKTLIYNNTISGFHRAITITGYNMENLYIHDNFVNKVRKFIQYNHSLQGTEFTGSVIAENFNIYSNRIYINPGPAYGVDGVIILSVAEGQTANDFNVYNNTIVTDNVVNAQGIVLNVATGLTATNFNIKNNILGYMNNVGPFIVSNSGTINGLHIENNLSYNLADSNILPIISGNAITNYTYLNNIPTSNTTQQNPLFVSSTDFHLQAGSPAVDAGIDVGLAYNGSAPDIGAFELGGVLGASKYNFIHKLQLGSIGSEVKELQKILISSGYLKITTPTNTFGPLTLKALKEYQKANRLTPDGIMGAKTREVLNR